MFEKKITEEQKKKKIKENKRMAKQAKKEKRGETIALSLLKTLVIPAIFAAIVVYVLYEAVQNRVFQEELRTSVVCMKENVKANTYAKSDEIKKYFTTTSVERTAVPKTAVKSLSELGKDGFYIKDAMSKSQMVLRDNLADTDEVMDKYLNGYEVTSFAAESFDGGVNGSLRKGDIVSVYAIDPATELLTLMVDNVYIANVYDSSGNKISEDGEIATSFTVYVTESEVEQINKAVVYGGIQMYLKAE